MTAIQLRRRLESLEGRQPGQKYFQFPELRKLLQQYESEGMTEEQAAAKASEYYHTHYDLPVTEKIARYEAYFDGTLPVPEDLRDKFSEYEKMFTEQEQA